MKEAGVESDTTDDVTYLQGTFTLGADYAVASNIVAGLDVGASDFDGAMTPLAGIHGLYKLGFDAENPLHILDAVQVGYHYLMATDPVHEVRAGILIKF